MKRHTISILCDDVPGVLTRISGLFSRRGFNIESLSVANTEREGKSRFTIVLHGDERILEQVRKQLQKVIHVINVWDYQSDDLVAREHALIKIEVSEKIRGEILQIVNSVQAKIVDSSEGVWILEVTGEREEIDTVVDLLKGYTIIETIRTGQIALRRGLHPDKLNQPEN